MAGRTRYEDGWWQSPDGLKLHYRDYAARDYAGGDGRPPILCIPGLSRNARDFQLVAERLSPDWRVICCELRGRGESAPAPEPMTYQPPYYVKDLEALLDALAVERVVLFGTSLGGLLSMMLTATHPTMIAGVLLNDIGPVIENAGLARIKAYVGKGGTWPTWVHCARTLAELHGESFPDYDLEDWLGMAKRLCRTTSSGRIVYDYDLRIAEPMRVPEVVAPPNLWPVFESIAGRPSLLIRGERSELLSPVTAEAMRAAVRGLEVVTVPRVGHAPALTEPESVAAIDRLLAKVA